jgi:hypothetical protein
MTKSKKLKLPKNWEKLLEQMMLQKTTDIWNNRIYIASPCRADTHYGILRNMIAARIYMFYTYIHFSGAPLAPHAYLPIFFDDDCTSDRTFVLELGKKILKDCDRLFVCGDRLSDGMYSEIKIAAKCNMPIQVFHKDVHTMIYARFISDGLNMKSLMYDKSQMHFTLSLGADKLAPYWEEGSNDMQFQKADLPENSSRSRNRQLHGRHLCYP